MSAVAWNCTTDQIATGTDAKTLLQLAAGADHRAVLNELAVSFKGTSPTGTPILVELVRQTTAGTMTAATVNKQIAEDPEDLGITAGVNATVEPTEDHVIRQWLIHPQSGLLWQAPFGGAVPIPGGTRLGIRVTAAASVNAVVSAAGEE
jgi:hypothetical protein